MTGEKKRHGERHGDRGREEERGKSREDSLIHGPPATAENYL